LDNHQLNRKVKSRKEKGQVNLEMVGNLI